MQSEMRLSLWAVSRRCLQYLSETNSYQSKEVQMGGLYNSIGPQGDVLMAASFLCLLNHTTLGAT